MVGKQNRKTVTLRLTIRRENVKLDKLNFKSKYWMAYNRLTWKYYILQRKSEKIDLRPKFIKLKRFN